MGAFISLGTIALPTPAHALDTYLEFGGNLGNGTAPSGLFRDAAPTALSSPLFIPVNFLFQLQAIGDFPQLQLGLANRYGMGSGVDATSGEKTSYSFVANYPTVRIELWRLVLGVGYTPIVWNGLAEKRLSASALLLEGSFLFPITPEIDFGLNLARERIVLGGVSPAFTTTEYGAFFRINFGMNAASEERKRKFRGWRYPFGVFGG